MTQVATTNQQSKYVLVMKNKSVKFLSKNEYLFARREKENGSDGFWISGEFTAFNMIGEWLTEERYRSQYPSQSSQPYENWTFKSEESKKLTKRTDVLKGIIRGITRYIESTKHFPLIDSHGNKIWYQGTDHPIKIKENLEKRLEYIKIGKDVDEVSVGGMVSGYMGYSPRA